VQTVVEGVKGRGADRWRGVGGTASVMGSRRAVPEGRPARKVVGEA
jgi:hypothetical protein